MLVAVNLAVAEVVLVGEISLEAEMLTALATFEALLVEDHFVDRSDLLDLVDAVAAPRAFVRRRRSEQVAQSFRRRRGRRQRRRRRSRFHRRHGPADGRHRYGQITSRRSARSGK